MAKMFIEINNGNGGLLITDEYGKWYYFDASELPINVAFCEDEVENLTETIKKAIEAGDLYDAEDFVIDCENECPDHFGCTHKVKEYDGFYKIDEVDNWVNTVMSNFGDRVPIGHDKTTWHEVV